MRLKFGLYMCLAVVIGTLYFDHCYGQTQLDNLESRLQSASGVDKIKVLNQLSQNHLVKDPNKSVEYGKKALKLAREAGEIGEESTAHIHLGHAYSKLGDYEMSISSFGASLQMSEQHDNDPGIAYCLNQMGMGYKALKEFDKAIQSCERSLKVYKQLKDQNGVAHLWSNLGDIHLARDQYDEAISYYQKALQQYEKLNDMVGFVATLNIIGSVYSNWGNYPKALQYLNRASKQAKANNLMALYIKITTNLAIVTRNLNQYEGTKSKYDLAQEKEEAAYIAKIETKNLLIKEEVSEFLTRITKLDVENQNKELKLKVQQDEFNNTLLINRYESEQNEKKILLLSKEKEISTLEIRQQEAEIRKQRMILGTLIILMVLVLALAFLLYNRMRMRQKARLNEHLLKQNEIRLKTIVETQEKERQRIARDLHDGLGQQLAGLKINLSGLNKHRDTISLDKQNIFDASIERVDEVCVELRNIAHQMMPRALSVAGLVPAIEDLLQQLLGTSQLKYNFEAQKVEKLPEHMEIGVFRVVQELINNILKHAKAQEISVQLFRNRDHLVLIVEDDGIGIKSGESDKKGIGLMNISARVQALNGSYSFDSGPNAGTVTNIRIPLSAAQSA
ncbi:MAG: tetratricopeptide repeat protein [Flavobacteriales bacterium]|nr:tetratricopeptide repeat protein [Flavobacteriales bacterium]